ncbi:hypothetical protein EGR_06802 [Echinococcus granulosus]|uniref:Uncharacterized protein n=1 Tax=Echinococcus granulosus TaxID=6210 RepID=W6UBB5_ECHGR|nr:hypothetical protein EGR_06802 [Echinococcus granulosus]EUB58395.1 hypothetical protein EGR_06802 [Echinococcus granulosus]
MRLILPFTLLLLLGRFSRGPHDATGLIFTREVDLPSGYDLDVSKQESNERGSEGEIEVATWLNAQVIKASGRICQALVLAE